MSCRIANLTKIDADSKIVQRNLNQSHFLRCFPVLRLWKISRRLIPILNFSTYI